MPTALLKVAIAPTDRQYNPALKIADTIYISRSLFSFDHLNITKQQNIHYRLNPIYLRSLYLITLDM